MNNIIFALFFFIAVHLLGNSPRDDHPLQKVNGHQGKEFIGEGRKAASGNARLFRLLPKAFSSNQSRNQFFELYDEYIDFLIQTGDYDSLIQSLHTVRGLLNHENEEDLIPIYIRLAYAHHQQSNVDSLIFWRKQVEVGSRPAEYRGMILLVKGLESSYQASYSQSIALLLEAAEIFEGEGQSANLAKAYQSLVILQHPFLTAQNLTNRANILEKLGDYPGAARLFLACKQLSAQHEITYGLLLSHLNLGNLYRLMKKYSLSESNLDQAMSLAKSLQLKKEEALVYQRLAWLEGDRGAFDKAYQHLTLYNRLNDSLVNQSVRITAKELKTIYESDRQENEIYRLSKDKLYQQYLIALIVGLCVILVIVIFWIRKSNQLGQVNLAFSKNLNQANEKALKLRDKDLLQQTMEKVALKEQMQELVNKINEGNSQENLITQVRTIALKQSPWNDIVEKFKLLQPEFIEKLMTSYPQLTQNDIELCSLIKLNLSTKEIAQILRIIDQSVRTKKYRLLKKLDLTKEKDLVTWVNALAAMEK